MLSQAAKIEMPQVETPVCLVPGARDFPGRRIRSFAEVMEDRVHAFLQRRHGVAVIVA